MTMALSKHNKMSSFMRAIVIPLCGSSIRGEFPEVVSEIWWRRFGWRNFHELPFRWQCFDVHLRAFAEFQTQRWNFCCECYCRNALCREIDLDATENSLSRSSEKFLNRDLESQRNFMESMYIISISHHIIFPKLNDFFNSYVNQLHHNFAWFLTPQLF